MDLCLQFLRRSSAFELFLDNAGFANFVQENVVFYCAFVFLVEFEAAVAKEGGDAVRGDGGVFVVGSGTVGANIVVRGRRVCAANIRASASCRTAGAGLSWSHCGVVEEANMQKVRC